MRRTRVILGVLIFLIMLGAILYHIPWNRNRVEGAQLSGFTGDTVFISKDETLEVWNVSTGKRENVLKLDSNVTAIAAGEKTFIGTSSGEIHVLNETTWETEVYFKADSPIEELHYQDQLYVLAGNLLGDEKQTLSTGPLDGFCVSPQGDIATWNGSTLSKGNFTISKGTTITDCSFSDSGRMAVAYKGKVEVYQNDSLIFEEDLEKAPYQVEFLKERVVCSGGSQAFKIFDPRTGDLIEDKDFEDDQVKDLDVHGGQFSVTISNRVYIYDADGRSKAKVQAPPSTPMLMPLIAAGVVPLGALTLWSEFDRRKRKEKDVYYKEDTLPLDEVFMLGSLGIFSVMSFMLFFFVMQELLIPLGLWMSILFVGIQIGMLATYPIIKQREVKLDSDTFYFSTSLFQELYKGKARKAKLNKIKEVHPNYFYNKPQETMNQIGFQVVTWDGSVGDITFSQMGRDKKIRKLEDSMKKAFSDRWDKVYVDKPYIDDKRWEEIGHLADQKWTTVQLKFMLPISPVMILPVISVFFIDDLSITTYSLIIFGIGAVAIGGMMYGVNHLMKFKKAQSIQAKRKMREDIKTSYKSLTEDKETEVEPEKYLEYDDEDWKDVQKKVNLERPIVYSTIGLMGSFLVLLLLGISLMNIPLLVLSMTLMAPLMFIAFYSIEISKARNIVKNAVEHELETGEKALPSGFEIPPPIVGTYISREPIDITEEEKKIADDWTSQTQQLKLAIATSLIVFIPIGTLLLFPEIFDATGFYVPFGMLMIPIFLFMWYTSRKQKIVSKVEEAERIEELLEEREEE